ncbi:MAG TPA: hypothetical protein VIE89_19565 [Candidatus Binatia bacterium]|jgi:hypothetical protein
MKHQPKSALRDNYSPDECLEIHAPLPHINSICCWCDPIIEFSENEEQYVIHREVIWN